ncbi:5-deoxy-glucuronate isomerase [Bengtsoniella intestinalis]|uniref:5-deoxy-glucuronate isomerase n=1 Tax=Bengtsoniella intestinalis TaxID=3073143 RepID=UPI00391FC239
MRNKENQARMEQWSVQSPEIPGFHPVITPEKCECYDTQIFRLNLVAGDTYTLDSEGLELNAALIAGAAQLSNHPVLTQTMKQYDSFYIPGKNTVTITAVEDCIFYIGGAVCEGIGEPFFRSFDLSLPLGDIHQIHGSGSGSREVMFTLNPQDKASRLIAGLTWGNDGGWTSWPPHQHEKDLEEVYCYFNIPAPRFGLHLSYLKSGEYDDVVAHVVTSGTMVQAPMGYHPTVGTPGGRNWYFWVLGAHSHASRRYDLAVLDPLQENF